MAPLHIAAERGYVKMVDYLIGKGADIGIQDKEGVIICDCFNNNWVWASLIMAYGSTQYVGMTPKKNGGLWLI